MFESGSGEFSSFLGVFTFGNTLEFSLIWSFGRYWALAVFGEGFVTLTWCESWILKVYLPDVFLLQTRANLGTV